MALRPGRAYRRIHRPYTRQSQRKPRKGYIKGVPTPKITEFEIGRAQQYDKTLVLRAKNSVQIRHNALEAARIAAVQALEKKLGKGGEFFLKVRVYPHHVLRENALATGAGADRFQQGMRQSFGKPVSTAAQVRQRQPLMEVRISARNEGVAKLALEKARHKLPTPCTIAAE